MEREHPEVRVEHNRCPFCHDAVGPADPKVACDGCMAWHHRDCWQSHGTCSACGFASVARQGRADPPRPRESSQRCVRLRCTASVPEGHIVCERHRRQDANACLWIGVLGLLLWGALFAVVAGGSFHGPLGEVSLSLAVLGAILTSWGIKGRLELQSIARASRRRPDRTPTRAK